MISDPVADCPIVVAAARVCPAQDRDLTPRFVTGWGTTVEEASRNCVFEANETYFAQILTAERVIHARFDEVEKHAIAPPNLLLFSERQFRSRLQWNKKHPGKNEVPNRWHRTLPIDWIGTIDFLSSDHALIPARLCVLGYSGDHRAGLPKADSSGLATGKTLSDAATRGFFELVERDSVAIWWYNKLIVPRLAPSARGDPLLLDYESWLESRSRRLILLKLTQDLEIPVVCALSHDANGSCTALGCGVGMSFCNAARHAVGELAQCEANIALLKAHASNCGPGKFTMDARNLFNWYHRTNIYDHPYLLGGELVDTPDGNINFDFESSLDLCRRKGLKLLTVDLTTQQSGPLARVFVPTLRSIRPRFADGRLYDVPRRMGLNLPRTGRVHETPFPF